MNIELLTGLVGLAVVLIIVAVVLLFRQGGEQQARLQEFERDARELAEEVARLNQELDITQEQYTRTSEQLRILSLEKERLEAKGKEFFVQNERLSNEVSQERAKANTYGRDLSQIKEQMVQKEKVIAQQMERLGAAQKSFEAEQERLRKREEMKQAKAFEEKQRLWHEHESNVVSELKMLCTLPEISFPGWENNQAPDEFGGKKPDWVLQVMDRFLVFDAKTATSNRKMGQYLAAQAKSTAEKYSGIEDIHKVVYFVLPNGELDGLNKTHWHEGGFDFFAITNSACAPILRAWKRMELYANLSEIDPAERESLVELIARYDQHLAFRSAVDIKLAEHGRDIMESKEHLSEGFSEEIEHKKRAMGIPRLSKVELTKLTRDASAREQIQKQLTTPKPGIAAEALDAAEKLF